MIEKEEKNMGQKKMYQKESKIFADLVFNKLVQQTNQLLSLIKNPEVYLKLKLSFQKDKPLQKDKKEKVSKVGFSKNNGNKSKVNKR